MKVLKAWYRKLVPLYVVDTTTRIVLERTLDKAEKIKAVLIVFKWDDGTWDMDWSTMKNGEFAVAHLLVQAEALRVVRSNESQENYRT